MFREFYYLRSLKSLGESVSTIQRAFQDLTITFLMLNITFLMLTITYLMVNITFLMLIITFLIEYLFNYHFYNKLSRF